jgi:hypothetical protein
MNLKTNLVLLLGVIMGVSLCQLFKGCGGADTSFVRPAGEQPVVINKEFLKKEMNLVVKMDSLTKHGTELGLELSTAKKSLEKLNKKNAVLQAQVYDLLDRNTPASNDTVSNKDSVRSKVMALIENDNAKDSLTEKLTDNLESQLINKDSLICLQELKYAELKGAFKKCIDASVNLASENNHLQKQFKRQKIKGKFLSAFALLLSGAAAGILLHH